MTGYPSAWDRFDRNMPSAKPHWFGFNADLDAMNKFAARFRLASSFNGLSLSGYSQGTINGYCGLIRTLLVWSAYEQYMKIIDIKQMETEKLLIKHKLSQKARAVIEKTPEEYYLFLYSRVNKYNMQGLQKCFLGKSNNVSYLASAIRHIFAHGVLTPHARGTHPDCVAGICDGVSNILLELMDRDFTEHIVDFEKLL